MATKSDNKYVQGKLFAALTELSKRHKDFHFTPDDWEFKRTYAKGQGKPVWELLLKEEKRLKDKKLKWSRISSLYKAKDFAVAGMTARVARRDPDIGLLWVEPSSLVGTLYRPPAADGKSFEQKLLARVAVLAERVTSANTELIEHVAKFPKGDLGPKDITLLSFMLEQARKSLTEAHQYLMSQGFK